MSVREARDSRTDVGPEPRDAMMRTATGCAVTVASLYRRGMAPTSSRRDLGLAAVARAAGVSTATVSNVLNRPHMVAATTQARVRAAIAALDFVPNRAAATLRQGSNRMLGLVIPDVVNPFYAAMVDAVVDAADRHRYAVVLCVSHDDPARELRHFDMLAEQRAAGALVMPVTADSSRLSRLRAIGARLILIDRTADEHEMCSVAVDDVSGGRLAVEHLLRTPFAGVTIVNGSGAIRQCADRREGALIALAIAGAPADSLVEIEVPQMSIDEGVAAGRRIARTGAPRRIFCTNDLLAVGVIRGLVAEGVAVPDDAEVVGYGDLALGTAESLLLTTIGQPKHELGASAVAKLMAELEDGSAHAHTATVLAPTLIVRGSTSAKAP